MYGLSPTEFEIMEVLWKFDSMTNKELILYFRDQGKDWKRQTSNTFFTRLMQKGLVSRHGHRYTAACTREEFEKRQAKEVLDTMYDGSLRKFISALHGGDDLSEEETRKLDELIRTIETE